MKITSETKERSCNNSPRAESKHFISKELMHAMRGYVFTLSKTGEISKLGPQRNCRSISHVVLSSENLSIKIAFVRVSNFPFSHITM